MRTLTLFLMTLVASSFLSSSSLWAGTQDRNPASMNNEQADFQSIMKSSHQQLSPGQDSASQSQAILEQKSSYTAKAGTTFERNPASSPSRSAIPWAAGGGPLSRF
jgi:hypothetical protein